MPPFALPRLPAPTASRLTLYAASSTAAAALVVLRACALRPSAFAVGVGLAKDSTALMVLGNLAVCVSLLAGIALQRLFFGRLRPIEVEHLYDKTWYFLTESLLAFTMFREDFNLAFLGLFGALLALKCFHWIAADRIDYLDQLAAPPRWTFHLRLLSLLTLVLLPLDGLLLSLTAASLLDRGISGRIVFVSEFAVLLVSLGGVGGRYAIWAWDQWKLAVGRRARRVERARRAAQAQATAAAAANGPAVANADVEEEEDDDNDHEDEDVWEGKSMALFYLDLTTDFLKLTVYLLFFILVLAHYGLPFNILRDLYLTSRSFLSRLRSLIQYRAATRDMELRYADATAGEIAEQGVCIICREEMRADDLGGRRAKRLGCGHAFHLRCLRMWLERQQSCPTCRRTVLGNQPPAAAPPAQQPHPAAPPAPGATPVVPAGGAAPAGPPAQGAHDRPLPPNVVRFGDRLAQHPPAPLNVPGHAHGQPASADGAAAAGGVGAGIFGAPNPPQRFAHLFPPAAAPAGDPAPQQQQLRRPRPGAGIELNLFGFELDFHVGFGGGGGAAPGAMPAQAAALAPRAPLAPVQHAPTPTPTAPVGITIPPPTATGPAPSLSPPAVSSVAASPPESDRTRLLRELSAAMSSDESAAFTRILTKIVQDATRIEIGEELAHARRFDVREALGRIVAALHDRPSQLAPTAALFPLVLGEADLSVVSSPTGGQRARLIDEDGTWVIDLGSRSALWTRPEGRRADLVETEFEPVGDGDDVNLDEERMTPRDIAARAALRRSARLNPTPPPTAAPALAPTPTQPLTARADDTAAVPVSASTSIQPLPQPSRIVELDSQSVFFAIPPPTGASSAAGPSTSSTAPASHASAGPSSSRPRVTLTPLHPVVNPTPLQQLVGSASSSARAHVAPLPTLPLPPTLSQAELDALALQTREAIEHRLAYIAQVDGVLTALQAELSRVHQAVVRAPTPASAARERESEEALRGLEELSRAASVERPTAGRDRKGKGRAGAVGGVEPRDVPLPADASDGEDDDDAWED